MHTTTGPHVMSHRMPHVLQHAREYSRLSGCGHSSDAFIKCSSSEHAEWSLPAGRDLDRKVVQIFLGATEQACIGAWGQAGEQGSIGALAVQADDTIG